MRAISGEPQTEPGTEWNWELHGKLFEHRASAVAIPSSHFYHAYSYQSPWGCSGWYSEMALAWAVDIPLPSTIGLRQFECWNPSCRTLTMSLGCSFNLHLFLRFVPFSIHFVPRFLHFRLFCHLYTPALNPHFTYQPSSSLQVRISLFVDKGWPVVNEVEYTSGGLEVVPVPIAREWTLQWLEGYYNFLS